MAPVTDTFSPPAIVCPAPPAAGVTVDSVLKTPVILHNKSIKSLSRERPGGSSPEFPITSGLTRGSISASFRMEMSYRGTAVKGYYCLWPQSAHVTLTYAPEVFIAQDYPPGRCRYEDTLHHEMRHVKMDQDIVREQIPIIKKMTEAEVSRMVSTTAAPQSDLTKLPNGFVAKMKGILQDYMKQLGKIRAQRQATIDTRAEYLRASHACAR